MTVEIRSERRLGFAVPPDELWAAFSRVDDYRRWWPWLRSFDAAAFGPGERWRCTVQPPLPYQLRFEIELGEVVAPERATATVSGDIRGEARLDVTAEGSGSELRLESRLEPASAFLRAIGVIAGPVARIGHDWVVDTGLRQFRERALPPR